MNYWLTVHWPPRQGENPDHIESGVWLPDGREAAGRDFRQGEKVIIYQSKTGRTEIWRQLDGIEMYHQCTQGKEGIVAICEATSGFAEEESSEPSKYADGSTIWWRWKAPVRILSRSGFVPRNGINRILGYKPNFNFHGFGDYHSGLKKIGENQFKQLVRLFREKMNDLPVPQKRGGGGGKGEESRAHYLLKHYVSVKPSLVLEESEVETIKVEYRFPTGDRADVFLIDQIGRIIAVEIEVDVNDEQLEGLLQAVKYRYMSEIITGRHLGENRAILIAYTISEKIHLLCTRYDVKCIEVSRQEVENWARTEEGRRISDGYKR